MNVKSYILILICFMFSHFSHGAELYEVNLEIYHKGKLIAQPEMTVKDSVESHILVSLPEQVNYECKVLLNAASENKVDMSISFVSGTLSLHPEFSNIDLGKLTSATINEFKFQILVTAATHPN